MTTTLRAAWEDRGVTDPAIMYRLTDVGIDIEHFDGYVDAGVDAAVDMYRLKMAGISPEVANAYRMEAPVSVSEMLDLSKGKVTPKLLKELLAQFPGSSITDAIAQKKGGIGKTMLNLLTKRLGLTDPELMYKISKKFNASDLSSFLADGATIDDLVVDGEVVRPNSFNLKMRKAGHPELIDYFESRSPWGYESDVDRMVAFAVEAMRQGRDPQMVRDWWRLDISVADAALLSSLGIDKEHYELIVRLGQALGRSDYLHMMQIAYECPGVIVAVRSRRERAKLDAPQDVMDRLKADFGGTARQIRNLKTEGPTNRSFTSGSELYRYMEPFEAAVWQSDLLGSVFGDAPYAHLHGSLFGGTSYAEPFVSWEGHGAEMVKRKSSPIEPERARRQVAAGVRSLVGAKQYFMLRDLGVPKEEMHSVLRQAKETSLDVITREMIGLPSLDEKELANVVVRPDFDWDDIEIEKED